MKSVKRQRRRVRPPFMAKPGKKYPFPTPIPPGSIVQAKASPSKKWGENIGKRFRIGYYSQKDGLDCIWLVNGEGEYEQTIDHDFLKKYFEIETVSNERSFYGRNRPRFQPMNRESGER